MEQFMHFIIFYGFWNSVVKESSFVLTRSRRGWLHIGSVDGGGGGLRMNPFDGAWDSNINQVTQNDWNIDYTGNSSIMLKSLNQNQKSHASVITFLHIVQYVHWLFEWIRGGEGGGEGGQ